MKPMVPKAHVRFSKALVFFASLGLAGCATFSSKGNLSATERARLYVEAANGALIENDPTGALQNLAQAEKLDSHLPEIYHSRSLAYIQRKDFELATSEALKALDLNPQYQDANTTLGKLYLDSNQHDKAIPHLKRAAEDPLYRFAYRSSQNLGLLFFKTADYEKAKKHFSRAIDQAPRNQTKGSPDLCVAEYYLAQIDLKLNQIDSALDRLQKANIRSCHTFSEAHFLQAVAYERNKQYDQARKKYLQISQAFSDQSIIKEAQKRLRYLP